MSMLNTTDIFKPPFSLTVAAVCAKAVFLLLLVLVCCCSYCLRGFVALRCHSNVYFSSSSGLVIISLRKSRLLLY